MKLGYARVSTDDQRLDLQINSLNSAGCARIYRDHGISGAQMKRPGLQSVMRALNEGDTLVVWRLDRLGRSLPGLVRLVESLGQRGIQFQSVTESFDTTSSSGKLIFHIMAALAEFERSLISERTRAGMIAASARGHKLGRPPLLSENDLLKLRHLAYHHRVSAKELAQRYGVSERTVHRYLETPSRPVHTPNLKLNGHSRGIEAT
jgi:DNA invertase Pin-like site-specific DNA recombinase